MEKYSYPAVFFNHEALRYNVRWVNNVCEKNDIMLCGVVKGANGLKSEIEDFAASGCKMIATSRLNQLRRCKEVATVISEGPDKGKPMPLLMIRVPMLSEVEELVELADYSLNSEMVVLEALNDAAKKAGKVHKVILMADLGDLREGWYDGDLSGGPTDGAEEHNEDVKLSGLKLAGDGAEEHNEDVKLGGLKLAGDGIAAAAVRVETELDGLELAGIGTNLGCVGSVIPDESKMLQLAALAERIEGSIGRRLEIVSGGATSSLGPVFEGTMPSKINMLRVGGLNLDGPIDPTGAEIGEPSIAELRDDCFILKAEVIENKIKPSHPVGTIGIDAFGKHREYVDKGIRRRALVAVGKQDYGDIEDLVPLLPGIEIWGASGDHTVLDIEDCNKEIAIGDIIEFKIKYSAILRLTMNEYVNIYDV